MYFCKMENSACGEINEQSFSNLHPCSYCIVADDLLMQGARASAAMVLI